MTMEFKNEVLVCEGSLTVEDAESLLQLLLDSRAARVDLAGCEHVHSACLQVLMAARVEVAAWPRQETLALWLQAALPPATQQDLTN